MRAVIDGGGQRGDVHVPVPSTCAGQASNGWGAACARFYHPVRTGRPVGQEIMAPPLCFDPCSHRETRKLDSGKWQADLRPLFAQGDRLSDRPGTLAQPSTPVRTGKPGWNPYVDPLTAFDPCPHRETPQLRHASSQTTLRPLFAQGDLGSPLARGS